MTTPHRVREGMCLADWQTVPGFTWDLLEDLDRLADLILPPKLTALTAYDFDTGFDSPNYGGFGTRIQLPAKRVVWHWWGNPSGQDPYAIIRWLIDPRSQVSAHAVGWPNNVACLVNYDQPSWANGNTLANITAITFEADPNHVEGTIRTGVEYFADLVRQNVLARDFELSGHKDWYSTACPGVYYPRLSEIRQMVDRNLSGQPNPTQPKEASVSESADKLWEALRPGVGGQQNAGYGWHRMENIWYPEIIANQRAIISKLDRLLEKPQATVDTAQVAAAIAAAMPELDISGDYTVARRAE